MIKKKILKRPGESCKNTQQLKKGVKIHQVNAVKKMKDKQYIAKALWECIAANDVEGFKEIISAHLALVQPEEFSKKSGISKAVLSKFADKKGNPTLDNISKVIYHLHTSP